MTANHVRPLYSFELLLPHREKEDGWSCDWPDAGRESWEAILPAQSYRCFYCGNLVLAETITKDHLYPISKGGCGCIGNLVGACFSCNAMKRDKTLSVFLRERPSFLRTMGEFSTRILYFKRDALFWDFLALNIGTLSASKRIPLIGPQSERARYLQSQKVRLYRSRA